jgi:hypothetical protein
MVCITRYVTSIVACFPYHLFCKRKLKFHFNMQQERDLMMIIKSQRAKL